jgi:hypothetical protein
VVLLANSEIKLFRADEASIAKTIIIIVTDRPQKCLLRSLFARLLCWRRRSPAEEHGADGGWKGVSGQEPTGWPICLLGIPVLAGLLLLFLPMFSFLVSQHLERLRKAI